MALKIQVYPAPQVLTYLGATKGDYGPCLNLAIEAFGGLIARATVDNEQVFTRAEWNLIADANNGTLFLADMDANSQLWTNVADGHRLNALGDKWLGEGADEQVASVIRQLREMDSVHAWAVVWAVRVFWRHCQDIDHESHEWWTLRYRRERLKSELEP